MRWKQMGGAKLIVWSVLVASSAVHAQDRVTANVVEQRSSVPAEYAGDWVCQSAVAGYNLPVPVVPGQAPSTQRMTTPPSMVVIKFTLAEDGTYQAANATGHYSFHAADKGISWVDGLHREQFSNTKLSRRSDGAPSLSFTANQRYYGCYLSKGLGTPGPKSSDAASTETRATPAGGRARYTKEEFLALGRQRGKGLREGRLHHGAQDLRGLGGCGSERRLSTSGTRSSDGAGERDGARSRTPYTSHRVGSARDQRLRQPGRGLTSSGRRRS